MNKLEQKHLNILEEYEGYFKVGNKHFEILDKENFQEVASKSVELSKDIAVKFACWADDNYWRIGCSDLWQDSPNFQDKEAFKYITQELFDKFLEKYE